MLFVMVRPLDGGGPAGRPGTSSQVQPNSPCRRVDRDPGSDALASIPRVAFDRGPEAPQLPSLLATLAIAGPEHRQRAPRTAAVAQVRSRGPPLT